MNQLHGTENRLHSGPRAAELAGRPILALFGAKRRASWLRLGAQVWRDWRAGVRHVTKFCHLSRLASPHLEAETGELRFGPEVGQKEKGNRAALIILDCHRT